MVGIGGNERVDVGGDRRIPLLVVVAKRHHDDGGAAGLGLLERLLDVDVGKSCVADGNVDDKHRGVARHARLRAAVAAARAGHRRAVAAGAVALVAADRLVAGDLAVGKVARLAIDAGVEHADCDALAAEHRRDSAACCRWWGPL
jgi:hypothetical protein